MFRCVKVNRQFEIQIAVGDTWVVYQPYIADRWDVLMSKIMRRQYERMSCERSQKSFDNITAMLYDCCKKYYWEIG